MNTFKLVQRHECYMDYERSIMSLPDDKETELIQRLTFDFSTRTCYVTVVVTYREDDMRQVQLQEKSSQVDLPWGAGLNMINPEVPPTPSDVWMTQEAYLKDGGQHCPRCMSSNISASDSQVDGNSAWQQIECGDCGLVYQDVFNLVAYHAL